MQWMGKKQFRLNRSFPSSLVPLFQSESKCETILMKMTLICMKKKLHAELISIWKVSHLDSFWNRGIRELGNGLLIREWSILAVRIAKIGAQSHIAPWAEKMNQIRRYDCLPEMARLRHLYCSEVPAMSCKKKFTESRLIQILHWPSFSVKMAEHWPCSFFCESTYLARLPVGA